MKRLIDVPSDRRTPVQRKTPFAAVAALFLVGAVLFPSPAHAGLILFSATGQDTDKEPLNATAQFTTGPGTLSIVLTNLVSGNDVRSAGQAISGIQFTLSTTPTSVSGAGDSGQLINVGSGGSVTTITGNPDRWEASGHITTSGSTIELLVLGGGQPSQMILGLPDSSGVYANANASITTTKNFSPWVEGSGTFTLSAAGITSNTTVTSATFFFGTGPDTSLPGTQAVPAPPGSVLAAVGAATIGIAWLLRFRRLRQLARAT
jgi:hypothetical protein